MLGGSKQNKQKLDTPPGAQRDPKLGLSSLLGKGISFAALMSRCPVLRLFPKNLRLKQPAGHHFPRGYHLPHKWGGLSFAFVYTLTT